jgi:hypothetical protein
METCIIKSEITAVERRTIGWGDLEIYEFPNILGDHPGLTGGAPITIDWEYDRKRVMAIDFYEQYRQLQPRRSRKELQIPCVQRDTL